jgi:hypothetical protein
MRRKLRRKMTPTGSSEKKTKDSVSVGRGGKEEEGKVDDNPDG